MAACLTWEEIKMNDYSNLYGNPESSAFVSATYSMKTPYGDAIDPGQFMSANNLVSSSNLNAISSGVKGLFGGLTNAMSYSAIAGDIDDQIYQLKYALNKNRTKILYDWRKQNAADMLSFWGSGVSPTSGSAAGVLTSNKGVIDQNISEMERQVWEQIRGLQRKKKNAKKSAILGTVSNLVTAGLSFGS